MATLSTTHPLAAPLAGPAWRWPARLAALLFLLPSAALLGVAAWLRPDPAGVGTHTQLGLPACGFLASTGLPCGTCGMTTAFAYSAHGQIGMAFVTQPFGAALAIATAGTIILCLFVLVTGKSLAPLMRSLWRPSLLFVIGVFFVASWGYKILAVRGFFW